MASRGRQIAWRPEEENESVAVVVGAAAGVAVDFAAAVAATTAAAAAQPLVAHAGGRGLEGIRRIRAVFPPRGIRRTRAVFFGAGGGGRIISAEGLLHNLA